MFPLKMKKDHEYGAGVAPSSAFPEKKEIETFPLTPLGYFPILFA